MNLFGHVQTIKRWINSCDTSEQLKLVEEIIDEFITKRFEGKVKPIDLIEAQTILTEALADRIIYIVSPV